MSFVIIFVTLVIAGSALEHYMTLPGDDALHRLGNKIQHAIASLVGVGMSLVSLPVDVHGTTLTVAGRSVVVATECVGIRATAIFLAGVLGFPCSMRNRVIGLLLGIVGVSFLNMVRIAILAAVQGFLPAWFETVHSVLMQGFLVVFVAPLWIAWMLFSVKSDNARWAALHSGSDGVQTL